MVRGLRSLVTTLLGVVLSSGLVPTASDGGSPALPGRLRGGLPRARQAQMTQLLVGPAGAERSVPGRVESSSRDDCLLFGIRHGNGLLDEVSDRAHLRVDGAFEGSASFRRELFRV